MKHKQIILFLPLLLIYCICFWQKVEKVVVSNQDPYQLYAYEKTDTSTLFYLKLVSKIKPIGVLVILPAGGDMVEDVMKQMTLHKLAVEKGLLVIFSCSSKHPVSKFYYMALGRNVLHLQAAANSLSAFVFA